MEAERLQIRSVFSPSRIVELEPIAVPLLFVGNVEDFDAILLGENPAFSVVLFLFLFIIAVLENFATGRRCVSREGRGGDEGVGG